MAIVTDNEKLAIIEMDDYWEPGIPLLPGTFDQGDKQQLVHGYPNVLYASETSTGANGNYIILGRRRRRS